MGDALREKAGRMLREHELELEIQGGAGVTSPDGNREVNYALGAVSGKVDALRALLRQEDTTKEEVHGVIFRQKPDLLDRLLRQKSMLQVMIESRAKFDEWAGKCRIKLEIVREIDATRVEILETFMRMKKEDELNG